MIPSGPEPIVLQMPVDVRSVALSILAGAATIMLLRYMQDVFIPLVLGGLLFYALDPFVDRLERLKVPRAVAAGAVLFLLVGATASVAYALRFQVMAVVEQMPPAAQRFRDAFRGQRGQPGTLGKMQEAAKEIEKTADSVAGNDTPRGVTKVQIEEPAFAARAYLWAGSLGALSMAGQAVMVLLLTFFLLLSDDLFKRKLVEGMPDLRAQEADGAGARSDRRSDRALPARAALHQRRGRPGHVGGASGPLVCSSPRSGG